MPFKVTWQPVLQALKLKDYHPAYADETIMVCVNPKPEFWEERKGLMMEYQKRLFEAQLATTKANTAVEDKQEAARLAEETTTALSNYAEQVFVPGIQNWFARLWSFGDEQWTVQDLDELERADEHLLIWLKNRSIAMIEEHRQGKKKA